MQDRILELCSTAINEIENVATLDEINNLRTVYLSKKSELMSFMSKMRDFTPEERSSFGQLFNKVKQDISNALDNKKE